MMAEELDVVKKKVVAKKKAPAKTVVDEKELINKARAMQTGIGFKTASYLKFVKDNKADMPNEYKLVEDLIKRYA